MVVEPSCNLDRAESCCTVRGGGVIWTLLSFLATQVLLSGRVTGQAIRLLCGG